MPWAQTQTPEGPPHPPWLVLIRQLERNFMGNFGIQWVPYLEAGTVAFGFSYSRKMNAATSQDEDEAWPCPNSLDLVRAESHADVRLLGLDNPPRMSQRKRSNPALNVATFLVAAGVAQTNWTGHGTKAHQLEVNARSHGFKHVERCGPNTCYVHGLAWALETAMTRGKFLSNRWDRLSHRQSSSMMSRTGCSASRALYHRSSTQHKSKCPQAQPRRISAVQYGKATPSQWLLGHILRLLDDRRWLLAHSGLDLVPPSSRFAESLAPGGRFASTAYFVASKTQAPNPPELESEYPQGRHRAFPFPVQEADASLADNVLFVRARSRTLGTWAAHLREMDAINLDPSLSSFRSSARMTPLHNATSNQDKFDGEMIRDASENKSQRSQAQTLKILIWGVDN
ncbi:uncharacterized protein NECHADRAFT_81328 [Fusarium vanettenii 77-13-4]|uniref:Uncharacterized protein n=1 Tax=Fusarium vanettenii (strain ATCC MYA-4622 / CBS 123669 / FGSC 9596 / NRRL 45880 / 77-13-4) TaxID=660122 RepID=C7ZKS7_FUSV7|nr:uncharacterized protein NECHADRAFT_81328 [Fusarium vanettenii 77-13-4]EEU35348.1 predicted protein [Fusarium vanettenii 77-13-4]